MRKNSSSLTRVLVAGVVCAMPVVGMVQGCGGGGGNGGNGGPTTPANAFVGSYTGSYRVTSGPSSGETGRFTMRVEDDGDAVGSVTDAGGRTAEISGTCNLTSGRFTLTGVFPGTGVTGRATGTLTATSSGVTGTGTFELINGNSGPISIRKN